MSNVKENFKAMVRRILKEEISKRDTIEERVPEQDGNGLDKHKDKEKTFATDENPRDRKTKDQLLSDLTKDVHGVDDQYIVVWDDNDDLKVDARDLMSIRIAPDWEDHYDITLFTRNEDRVYVTGLDWKQVKDFVKKNLETAKNPPTAVEKAWDKAYRNRKDETKGPDSGMPQKDKPKIMPTTDEAGKMAKDQNVKEDDPNQPMKEVGDVKKQVDHKAKRPPTRLRGKQVTKFRETQR